MAKLYTLDGALLTGCPEIDIGGKRYAVDDRVDTVQKCLGLMSGDIDLDGMVEVMSLAFGKHWPDIRRNLPMSALPPLFEVLTAAMTGQDMGGGAPDDTFPDGGADV